MSRRALGGSCADLVMREEVSEVCGARQSCSLLADTVTLHLISGREDRLEDRLEGRRGRSCHSNSSSVLRTTFACVDQSALLPGWRGTTTESAVTERSSSSPPLRSTTTTSLVEVFSADKESVIAKPLEPQPPGESSDADSDYLTNILIVITSSLTAGLSILLLTILYKLYQTFQTPPSSPLNSPLNNYSQHSLNTQLSHLTELTELTEVDTKAAGMTETGGTWPGKTERKLGVRFEDEPQPLAVSPLLREDKLTGQYFLREEAAEKWQFPRVAGRKIGSKYLSL